MLKSLFRRKHTELASAISILHVTIGFTIVCLFIETAQPQSQDPGVLFGISSEKEGQVFFKPHTSKERHSPFSVGGSAAFRSEFVRKQLSTTNLPFGIPFQMSESWRSMIAPRRSNLSNHQNALAGKAPFSKTSQSIWDYTTYAFAGGATATEQGLVWAGPNLPGARDVARIWPNIFDPTNPASYGEYGNILAGTKATLVNAGLSQLGLLNASSWNQFQGWPQHPTGWGDFQGSSFYSGFDPAAYLMQTPLFATLLGNTSTSNFNVGANLILSYYNFLGSPWMQNLPGFGGYSALPKASSQPAKLSALQDIEQRYRDIGEFQVELYYEDGDLSDLRAEFYVVLMGVLLDDPIYTYYNYFVNAITQYVYNRLPAYAQVATLANEIASWTSPPSSTSVLRERFDQRQLLLYYQAVLQYQFQEFLYYNPQVAYDLAVSSQAMLQQMYLIWGSEAVGEWYLDWSYDWIEAYTTSISSDAVIEEFDELLTDYPEFEEYLELNLNVVEQIPGLSTPSRAQRVTELTAEVLQDRFAHEDANQYYQTYTQNVNTLVNSTSFVPEMERYYERLNGLGLGDSDYRSLAGEYAELVEELAVYEFEMYRAINNCVARLGDSCNPYEDPAITDLRDYYFDLFIEIAEFYERYYSFIYEFYAGSAYANLESTTGQRLATALDPVADEIYTERSRFTSRVESIPEVGDLLDEMNDLGERFRSASSTFDSRLERMAEIVENLGGVTAVEDENNEPRVFKLEQNYPNPFNPSTTITFELPKDGRVTLKVYGVLGEEIATLLDAELASGTHQVQWQPQNFPSGVYFYRLQAGDFVQTLKLALIR